MEFEASTGAAGFTRRIALALATGYTLFFFSEVVFWSDPGRMRLSEVVATWIAYSLLAFVLLALVDRFRARAIWTVFLAGAIVGWLAEGVLVHTAYEALPFTIAWTGLAWHALLSVVVGWWLVGGALAEGRTARVSALAAGIGVFWGAWAIFWWLERGRVAPVGAFAGHVFVMSSALAISYAVQQLLGRTTFRATRGEAAVVGGLFLLAFVSAVVSVPVALIVLPPLLGLALFGMRRSRRAEQALRLEPQPETAPLRPGAYVCLVLIPACATAVYALAHAAHLRVATGPVLAVGTALVGSVMFVLSVRKALRGTPASERTAS